MFDINEWAIRHHVSQEALDELMLVALPDTRFRDCKSEAVVQQSIRLAAPKYGTALWRNNSGATFDKDDRMIRYGLGNDSKKINEKVKSSDLIGITPVVIEGHHLGRTLGVFTAVECKAQGWVFNPNSKREKAQMAFLQIVNGLGGIGQFATDPSDIWTQRS